MGVCKKIHPAGKNVIGILGRIAKLEGTEKYRCHAL